MKKLTSLIFAMIISTTITFAAENVKVSSLENFNTESPSQTIDVRVIEPAEFDGKVLVAGTIIHCEVLSVSHATRGKRNASFIVKPLSVAINDETTDIEGNWVGGYSKRVLSKEELKNIDKAELAVSATKSVGNIFIKGFGQGVSFARGVVENKGQKPIRSGIKRVYKDSPLSYVEKGEELSLTPEDTFYLVFKEVK